MTQNTKYWRGEEKKIQIFQNVFERIMDTQTLPRKEHKHITKENHQITKEEIKRKRKRQRKTIQTTG